MTELKTNTESPVLLNTVLTKSVVADMYEVNREYAKNNIEEVCNEVEREFAGEDIIIRSLAVSEDNVLYSRTGNEDVLVAVHSCDRDGIKSGINSIITLFESVIEYKKDDEKLQHDTIFVHRQYDNITVAGTIYTRDLIYNRPYYMVSYNYFSDDYGNDNKKKNKWIAKNVSREFLDDDFLALVLAVREIESYWNSETGLWIDFAIDKNEQVIIYNAGERDNSKSQPCPMGDKEFIDTKAFAKCNYLDHNNMLTDLLFWNPVEVIGANPRPLDYSIYKEIITSKIWRDAIASFGYSDEAPDLMHRIGNRPYLSIEGIFDAIIPKRVNSQLKYKLCEYYKVALKENKKRHKNTEFEILITSYDFNHKEKRTLLEQRGFTKDEISEIMDSVFEVTDNMINNYEAMCNTDIMALDELRTFRRQCRANTPLQENNVMKLYNYIKELMNSIMKNGTPQYIRQVRCKYVAVDICRTLVEKGYFDESEMQSFFDSIPTISKTFNIDFHKYAQNEMTREEFDTKYGHLRLGAYDIRSNCYRNKYFDLHSNNHMFFELDDENSIAECDENVTLNLDKLSQAIADIGYSFSAEVLYHFIVESYKNVDVFKYEFTKSLSFLLEIIKKLGELQMVDRDDMSYLEIQDLMDYHSRDSYIQIIEARRNMYYAYSYLMLPEFILDLGDIDVVDVIEQRPQFMTNNCIEAEIVNLDEECDADVNGKIVVLTKASQGYEWILTKNIVGIITKYSENTEYMSKWCKANGVPAAFGCGEMIFKKISSVKIIRLDCKNKMIVSVL